MIADKACYERGCACYDSWDGDGVKVVAVQQSNEQVEPDKTASLLSMLEKAFWRMYEHGGNNNPASAQCEVQALHLLFDGTFDTVLAWHPSHPPVPTAQHKDVEQQFIDAWNDGKVRRVSDGAKPWVGLTMADKEEYVALDFGGNRLDAMDWAAKRLKEKNT